MSIKKKKRTRNQYCLIVVTVLFCHYCPKFANIIRSTKLNSYIGRKCHWYSGKKKWQQNLRGAHTTSPCHSDPNSPAHTQLHWNMYITMCKIGDQWKFDAWSRAIKTSALGQPRGLGWGGGGEKGIRDGETAVYLWLINADVWQKPSQYCKVIILQLK